MIISHVETRGQAPGSTRIVRCGPLLSAIRSIITGPSGGTISAVRVVCLWAVLDIAHAIRVEIKSPAHVRTTPLKLSNFP
jgi:hypothetical protein